MSWSIGSIRTKIGAFLFVLMAIALAFGVLLPHRHVAAASHGAEGSGQGYAWVQHLQGALGLAKAKAPGAAEPRAKDAAGQSYAAVDD